MLCNVGRSGEDSFMLVSVKVSMALKWEFSSQAGTKDLLGTPQNKFHILTQVPIYLLHLFAKIESKFFIFCNSEQKLKKKKKVK